MLPNGAPQPDIPLAVKLFAELEQRTGVGRPGHGINRTSYGLGEQIAHEIVLREAGRMGMVCEVDAACNLYMTMKGRENGPAVMVGSHLDSVPAGGNFDGAAGVLAGLAVASGFFKAGRRPARDLTLMAIRAEESTWFGASYVGSRAAFGKLTSDELDHVLRAGDGIPLGKAIDAAGGDAEKLRAGTAHLDPSRIAAFLEPHIEQGPVLVGEERPIGLVTGIRGSFRHRHAWCEGSYAHSGATPRAYRRDAALATARLVVAMDDAWKRLTAAGRDLAVTFGQVATGRDAAFSKIAGRTDFSLDVRSEDLEVLDFMRGELAEAVAAIEAECNVRFHLGAETGSQPARMDSDLLAHLGRIVQAQSIDARKMPCGAGHDSAVFAKMGVPTAMIFIRNRNGSHNPQEAMEIDDFAEAARVLSGFCEEGPQERR
ncbi:hydantoinase/carbamoylase family amidase [Aquamicrobium sp. LC103]|uniref:hydantoinase/carbamoylase family amidase n=1 Tax=Aquamicrobium sp. LC103 TaxID=1120658 RepID=UPI001FEE02F1|nr:hydantoinase/carbamoylase family amidase [Aquamicrobium sp. LC103]